MNMTKYELDNVIEKIVHTQTFDTKKLIDSLLYGAFDGAHHKQWAIDQALRVVCGDMYDDFVEAYEQDGEYEWDKGITP